MNSSSVLEVGIVESEKSQLVHSLLAEFEKSSFIVNQHTLVRIKLLSRSNVKRLTEIILNLIKTDLLSHHTLNNAIDIITTKLPKVISESVLENTTDYTDFRKTDKRGKIKLNNNLTFFVENSSRYHDKGGAGSIKKGYEEEIKIKKKKPNFAIKRFFEGDIQRGYESASQKAIREVKYNRLLGRNAHYYLDDQRDCLITDWMTGKSLDHHITEEFINYPLEQRLCWLESMLIELNILHANFRVHGDIKPANLILNIERNLLHLIDFDSAHKAGSTKKFTYTSRYWDYSFKKTMFSMDLFALSFIIANLFPEFFIIKIKSMETKINVKQNLSVVGQAITELFDSLRNKEVVKRCTVKDALVFTQELFKQIGCLDQEKLLQLKNNTINKHEITFDDAIHGVRL